MPSFKQTSLITFWLPLSCLVHASPVAFPQAVTEAIAPPSPIPTGCLSSWNGRFGIAVLRIPSDESSSSSTPQPASQSAPSASAKGGLRKRDCTSTHINQEIVVGHVSQINDGQVQAGSQTGTATVTMMVSAVSQIGDGQIQHPPAAATNAAVIAAPGTAMVTVTGGRTAEAAQTYIPPVSADDSPDSGATTIFTSTTSIPSAISVMTITSTSTIPPPISTPNEDTVLVACRTDSSLELTLSDSMLYDSHNRTGYIASNFQFQFDGPPQAGALFTTGWSICPAPFSQGQESTGGHVLALGGSKSFWQCRSGDFYNLYDRWWAMQCEEVRIWIVQLRDC